MLAELNQEASSQGARESSERLSQSLIEIRDSHDHECHIVSPCDFK